MVGSPESFSVQRISFRQREGAVHGKGFHAVPQGLVQVLGSGHFLHGTRATRTDTSGTADNIFLERVEGSPEGIGIIFRAVPMQQLGNIHLRRNFLSPASGRRDTGKGFLLDLRQQNSAEIFDMIANVGHFLLEFHDRTHGIVLGEFSSVSQGDFPEVQSADHKTVAANQSEQSATSFEAGAAVVRIDDVQAGEQGALAAGSGIFDPLEGTALEFHEVLAVGSPLFLSSLRGGDLGETPAEGIHAVDDGLGTHKDVAVAHGRSGIAGEDRGIDRTSLVLGDECRVDHSAQLYLRNLEMQGQFIFFFISFLA